MAFKLPSVDIPFQPTAQALREEVRASTSAAGLSPRCSPRRPSTVLFPQDRSSTGMPSEGGVVYSVFSE